MAIRTRDILLAVPRWIKGLSWPRRILLAVGVFAAFSFLAIEVTGQPRFCNSCHIMNDYYASWESSSHSEVNCLKCHIQPGVVNYAKGKINGLAQAVDCMVGRVGTKPNGTVLDVSCLRSHCHDADTLADDQVDYEGIKFTHGKHIGKEIDGITISCGTCHSHYEGDEHFNVNKDVCFTCHFLKAPQSGQRLVETSCQSCHEVPDKVIQRGLVSINHSEFVSYQASCEDSCHRREIRKTSNVNDSTCLSCHSFRKPDDVVSEEIHREHSGGDKIECVACHGEIAHGQVEVESVSAMMDCRNCHSDTHQAQRSIYSTAHPSGNGDSARVLSPMFMTHVECTGCHIEVTSGKSGGAIDSFGKVAKAAPRACDNCHEPGTGQRYVPYWQSQIKKLYERVEKAVSTLEDGVANQADVARAKQQAEAVKQARAILDTVAADGSWGVHNFKYAESLLVEAEKIISQAK